MATRNVTTVFAVQGESEYRKAVQNINRSISEVNSELKLWEETFKGQEDTLKAQQERTRILNELYGKQVQKIEEVREALKNAQDAVEKYTRKGQDLQSSLDEVAGNMGRLENAGKQATEAYTKLKEESEKLQKEIDNNTAKLEAAERGVSDWKTSLNKAQTALENTKNELDGTNSKLKDTGDAFDAIADVIAAAGLERALDAFLDSMEACIDKSIEFESAMAGVFKTVDMSAEEELTLAENIKKLAEEIPVSTTELAGIAELAGQLGIANEDILNFTETMAKLGTSTNLSAEEAADGLAKFANIAGTSADDYERLGSTLVDLGNNFATTEADILDMATRLASTGSVVGLTEAEILAVATALSSVGTEAEAGGSAVSTLLKEIETSVSLYHTASDTIAQTGYNLRDLELMQSNNSKSFKELADDIGVTSGELGGYIDTVKNLNKYAEISGQSAEGFIQAWGDDAVSALDLFISGLGDMEANGGNAIETLEEMEITEVRLSNAVLALAESDGILTDALNTSKRAWSENTALSDEAARRYETTESKVQLLENSVGNLLTAIGDDYINALEPAIEKTTDFVQWLSEGAEASPALASAIAAIAGALAGLTGAAAIGSGVKLLAGAFTALNPTAKILTVTATAIGALAGGIATYVANADKVPEATQALIDANEQLAESIGDGKTAYDEVSDSIDENRQKAEALIEKLTALSEASEKTTAEESLMRSMVKELNDLLPGLGLTYDGITEKINLSREAMLEFAEESEKTAKLSAFEEYLARLSSQQTELQAQHQLTGEKIAEIQKKYEEARQALDDYEKKIYDYSVSGDASLLGTQEYDELVDNVEKARRELDALKESQTAIQDAMRETNAELAEAKEQYSQYADEAAEAESRITKFAGKIAEVEAGLQETKESAKAAYDEAVQYETEYYEQKLEAARETQAQELEEFEDAQDKKYKAFQKAAEKELKEYRKAQDELRDALEDRLDAEMEALEESHEARLEMIDEEYAARMKLLDEERYDAIKEIEDQIDAIDALTEAEEKAQEERERQRRISEAEEKVRQAENIEDRLKAQEDLNELLEKYERERLLEERELQKEALEAQIDDLEAQYDQKEELLKAEQKAAEEAEKAAYEASRKLMQEEHELQRELLEEQLDLELETFQEMQDEKAAAYKEGLDKELEDFKKNQEDTLLAMEEAHKVQLSVLEAHYAEQVRLAEESAAKQIEAYQRILSGVNEITQQIGSDFVGGFIKGIEEMGPHAASSVSRLGELALSTLRTELDEHSPSREARKIGQFFGEGLALGLTDSGVDVAEAIKYLSTEFEIAPQIADKFRTAQAEIGKFRSTASGVDAAAQYRDSMALFGQMSAQARDIGFTADSRPIEITVVSKLDGREISREVSRVQYQDSRLARRTRGK